MRIQRQTAPTTTGLMRWTRNPATAEPERGLPVPLLVTADEVGAAPVGGDVREALSDPVREETWKHDVRYHR